MSWLKSKLKAAVLRFLSFIPFFSLSALKSRIYRAFGAEIGEHVHFAPGAFIFVSDFNKLKIGSGVVFGRDVKITCEDLEVGDDTRFSSGVRAGGTVFRVGRSCYFFPEVYIDLNEPVIIEDDVGVGADYIFTHSIWHPVTEGGPRRFAPVHIKRGAWVPAGVFIMPGVTIGENATIGARSLVIEDVPDGCLAVGIPARVIKTAEEYRKELSSGEKDEIVRDIIHQYLERIEKNTMILSENRYIDESFEVVEVVSKEKDELLSRKQSWALAYKNSAIEENHIASLRSLCGRFDLVLFISLVSIPTKVIERLHNEAFSNLVWFCIESRMRRKSWKKRALSLHDFFRSHYGIRFRFYRSQTSCTSS